MSVIWATEKYYQFNITITSINDTSESGLLDTIVACMNKSDGNIASYAIHMGF